MLQRKGQDPPKCHEAKGQTAAGSWTPLLFPRVGREDHPTPSMSWTAEVG